MRLAAGAGTLVDYHTHRTYLAVVILPITDDLTYSTTAIALTVTDLAIALRIDRPAGFYTAGLAPLRPLR
jgi:hypothetical protein